MPFAEPEMTLLVDARLSADARVLGLYIASKGEGAHEIGREELGDVLGNEVHPERVRRAVSQLERQHYLERRAGGRGHADSFTLRIVDNFKGTDFVEPNGNKDTRNEEPKPDRLRETSNLNAIVVEGDDVEEPPIVPLGPKAEQAMARYGDKLAGCRGALRDYLAHHLDADFRRYSYIQTVASWLDDAEPSVWRTPTGSWLPHAERPALLAAALNELAAGDERKMKRPVGDPGNLKTKINILIRQAHNGREQRGDTRGAGSEGTGAPTDEQPRRRRGFDGSERRAS